MKFIDINTLEYPLTEYEIRNIRNPQVSLPSALGPSSGYARVVEMPKPSCDQITQEVVESAPVDKGTHWQQAWEIVELDEGTIAANQARKNEQAREAAKQARQKAVEEIKVTTQAGNTFDGDETSQTRMARAIIGLQAAGVPTITWTLADNTSVDVTLAELTEALILAGQEQARLWGIE